MKVQCTHCQTVFRVDPRKVPEGGTRARCSICRGVFEVSAPQEAARQGAAEAPAPPAPEQARAPEATPPSAAAPVPPPAAGSTTEAAPGGAPPPIPSEPEATRSPSPAPAPVPSPTPAPAQPPTPAPAAPAASGDAARPRAAPSPFGAADPQAKARRLARALVSDIVTYHPERRDQALEAGTLKQEFMEEIKKSWEEYVAQVGQEMARGTPHFRDALNAVLAKGQTVF